MDTCVNLLMYKDNCWGVGAWLGPGGGCNQYKHTSKIHYPTSHSAQQAITMHQSPSWPAAALAWTWNNRFQIFLTQMLGLKRAAVRWSVTVVINILALDGQQYADLCSVMIYWRVWPDLLLEGQGGNTVRQKEIVHFANGLHSTSVSKR